MFRGRSPSARDFALTCGWEALAIAIPFALGDWLALHAHVLQGMRYFGFYGQAGGWAIIVAIVVLPAAVASGIQFPLLVALLGQGNRDIGWHVGQTFAWNTLGGMVGSLAGGFGLLPLLSAPGAWKLATIVLDRNCAGGAMDRAIAAGGGRGRCCIRCWRQPARRSA